MDGDGVTGQEPPQPADFTVKVLQLHDLSLELGSSLWSGNMEGEGGHRVSVRRR